MYTKKMWLPGIIIFLLLTSCGPKPPEEKDVRNIVKTYLQEKIPGMVDVESVEITKLEKKSDSCTIYFKGVYEPTDASEGHPLRNTIGTMSARSDYLDKRLLSIDGKKTIEAFMMLTYDNGSWSLSKHIPSILIPKK